MFGRVDELTDLCSQIGITVSSKEMPTFIERVDDNSLAARANLGRGDRIIDVSKDGSKILLKIERHGQLYGAVVDTNPKLQKEFPRLDRPGAPLSGQAQQTELNGQLLNQREGATFDGIGGPGGSGAPGVQGHTDAPGWPGVPGGAGGRGQILAGADGVSGPTYADRPAPMEPPLLPGDGRPGHEGRPGQNSAGHPASAGGLGQPGSGLSGGEGIGGLPDFDFSPRSITGYDPAKDIELRILPTPVLGGAAKKPILTAQHKLNPLRITVELGGSYIRNSFNGERVKRLLLDQLADRAAQAINSHKFPPGAVRAIVVIDKQPYQRDLQVSSSFNAAGAGAFLRETSANLFNVQSDANKAHVDGLLDSQSVALSPAIVEVHAGVRAEDSFNNGQQMSLASLLSYNGNFFTPTPVDWSVHEGQPLQSAGSSLRPTQLQICVRGVMSGHCFDSDLPYLDWNRPDFDWQHPDRAAAMSELTSEEYPGEMPRFERRAAMQRFRQDRMQLGRMYQREGTMERIRMLEEQRGANRYAVARIQTVPDHPTNGLSRPVILRFSLGGSRVYRSFNNNGSMTALVNEFLDRLKRQVKPSRLFAIDHIVFRMEGAVIENCFNDT